MTRAVHATQDAVVFVTYRDKRFDANSMDRQKPSFTENNLADCGLLVVLAGVWVKAFCLKVAVGQTARTGEVEVVIGTLISHRAAGALLG